MLTVLSRSSMTARFSTLENRAIFSNMSGVISRSVRQMRMSGWIPIWRSFSTECCVGLVLASPAALRNGISVRWMYRQLCLPASRANWRIASRNGSPSMSPTVPPISVMTTSTSSVASLRTAALISSVTCGMTCTVRPR
jgi:hypothetical protein